MTRLVVCACAALLFAAAPARAAVCETPQKPSGQSHPTGDKRADTSAPQQKGPKKWWIDPELRAELAITDQQSAAIELVWQKSLAHRAETRDRLDKADAILQKLILDGADEAAVTAQLDRVEAARSEANKARVLLLYRMNRHLTQEQRVKLDAKFKAMRDREGRRGGPGLR